MDNQITAFDKYELARALRLKKITRKRIAEDLALSPITVSRLLDNATLRDARAERNWMSIKHWLYQNGIVVNYR